MRYLGGKSKIAKRLVSIIAPTYTDIALYEPFMGGGAMTAALAPRFKHVYASDLHEDLILMWKALQNGWQPPKTISETEYQNLKNSDPSPLRGFAGFAGASWGGKWFGGYARGGSRNYADEAARSLNRDIQFMQNVYFNQKSYLDVVPYPGSTLYADPPYVGTTGYGFKFDHIEFWARMSEIADSGVKVFVSEYTAPPDWSCVWELTRTRDMKSHLTDAVSVTERLFYKGPK